jgi:hypothetical protein
MVREGNHVDHLVEDTSPVARHMALEEKEVQEGHRDHPSQQAEGDKTVGDRGDVQKDDRQVV